ncbi:MAG: hypothetical protein ABIQ90_11220 [Polaromonas sp.]
MKRLFLLPVLGLAVVLLTACPDAKLPKPTPQVPKPKAETSRLDSPHEIAVLMRHADPVPLSIRS